VIDWMAVKPAEIFGIKAGTLMIGQPADIIIFDLENEIKIDDKKFASLGVNTPFTGWSVKGETLMTFVDGQLVYNKED
ncbi:MAG: amidohydrolase family protein, partial [Enterococcus sp.]